MRKTSALAAAVATLSTGMALADDLPRVDSIAPQPISEVRAAKAGTVVGTVIAVGDWGFVLDDGTGTLRVGTGNLDVNELNAGQQATVVGRFKHDEFRAHQLIREDGTAAVSRARHIAGERLIDMRAD